MAKAATNRVGLYYHQETAWGEAPTGAFTQLRYTGESLDRDKNTARSNTIREDRMTDELALLGFSVAGDVNFELSYGTYDTFLEHTLCSTFGSVTLATLTLTVAATAKTITRAAGSWITDGIKAGMTVKFGGFTNAGNNKRYVVASLTATVLTVLDPSATLVDETGSGDETAAAAALRNGVLEPSMVIEKKFADISKFMYFNGVRVTDFELDITAQQIITGKFGLMGKDAVPGTATVSTSIVPAGVSKLMTASANVGALTYAGALLSTGIRSIKLQVTNDLRKQDIVGQQATGGLGYGGFMVKGSIEAYFEDLTLLTDVINHTEVSLSFPTTDADGNTYTWNIPSIKLTKGSPKAPGGNQDVMLPLEFEAIRNATADNMITITK